jgi:hypothetical protein
MILFKKFVLALFINIAMLAIPSTVVAGEEISQESVVAALKEAISFSEEIVAGIQSGAEADTVEQLYKQVKYAIKRVVISDSKSAVPRAKANKRMKASRKAFRGGDFEKAASLAADGVKYYKQTLSNKI